MRIAGPTHEMRPIEDFQQGTAHLSWQKAKPMPVSRTESGTRRTTSRPRPEVEVFDEFHREAIENRNPRDDAEK